MKSCELVSFVTAVACNMANCYTEDELTLLSAIFTQLGDTLATILTNEELIESALNSKQNDTTTDDKNSTTDENNNSSNTQSSSTANCNKDSSNSRE